MAQLHSTEITKRNHKTCMQWQMMQPVDSRPQNRLCSKSKHFSAFVPLKAYCDRFVDLVQPVYSRPPSLLV